MILILHVLLFIYSDMIICDNLYRKHNICKYFELVSVHIQKL